MIISLLGYMGSGKSHISRVLSAELNYKCLDLDYEIALHEQSPVAEIFKNKGELHFRKTERALLEKLLNSNENTVLSLGGGTPVYYDNMSLINDNSHSFFLQCNLNTLVERLSRNKEKRPLIARISDEDLPEFIGKHLFERNPFYLRAKHTINTSDKPAEVVVQEIINLLPPDR